MLVKDEPWEEETPPSQDGGQSVLTSPQMSVFYLVSRGADTSSCRTASVASICPGKV